MHKRLIVFFVLIMVAAFCLPACSKKEEAPAPPPAVELPAPPAEEQAPASEEQAPPANASAVPGDNNVQSAPADQAPAAEPAAPGK